MTINQNNSLLPSALFFFSVFCLLSSVIFFAACDSKKEMDAEKPDLESRSQKPENRSNSVGHADQNSQSNEEIARLEEVLKEDPTRYEERHRLGVAYMMVGKHQEAVEEFLGVLSVKPDSVNALHSLGMTYYKMGKKNKAVFYWRSALEIQPENSFLWKLVNSISDCGSGIADCEKPDHNSQISNPKSEMELWSEHYKKGQEHYKSKEYEKAVEEFKIAVEQNRSDERSYFSLGVAYNAMNRMEEAVEAWRESLKLKPDDVMVMKLISMAKKKLEREKEIKKTKEKMEKEPENLAHHFLLAQLYIDDKHGRFVDQAEKEFKEVIRIDPKHVQSYSKLAEISFYRDRYDEGIEYMEKAALQLSSEDVLAQRLKAMKIFRKLYQKGKDDWKKGGIEKYDEMILVPGGRDQGAVSKSQKSEGRGKSVESADENPVHPVNPVKKNSNIKSFYIDKYEVTNAQYKRFLDENPGDLSPPQWKRGNYRKGKDNYPVRNIDWFMASKYCKSGEKRLPTEGEWQKAAGGTDGRIYPWGNELKTEDGGQKAGDSVSPSLQRGARGDSTFANSKESWIERLTPVGSFEKGASSYGVYDMAGNVWEWTATGYEENQGSEDRRQKAVGRGQKTEDRSEKANPKSEIQNPQSHVPFPQGNYKVIKGGSYKEEKKYLVINSRKFKFPTHTNRDMGFRCAKNSQ